MYRVPRVRPFWMTRPLSTAQAVERIRVRLSTAADRHRYATQGYAPLESPIPVQEAELAELQARDA
jgi:hypothetical protein